MPDTQLWSRALRVTVFALLLISTLAGLFLKDRLWALWNLGEMPLWAAIAPPLLFSLFVAVFALDRVHAVRSGALPLYRAMFQVGTSVLFLMLLMPGSSHDGFFATALTPPQLSPHQDNTRAQRLLLGHRDRAVRAATCTLLGHVLPQNMQSLHSELIDLMAEHAENDRAYTVRESCRAALLKMSECQDPVDDPHWSQNVRPEEDLPPGCTEEEDPPEPQEDEDLSPITL